MGQPRTCAGTRGILAVPMLIDPQGCEDDLAKLDQVVRAGTRLSRIWDKAHELLLNPFFIARRHAIEGRLGSQLSLDADEIAGLFTSDHAGSRVG